MDWKESREERAGGVRFLQETLRLRVVLGLDLVVIREVLLRRGEVVDLEALAVKCILVGLAADVMDRYVGGLHRPLVRLRFADILTTRSGLKWRTERWVATYRGRGRAAILVGLIVVQVGMNMVLGHAALHCGERLERRCVGAGGLMDCC